MQPRLEGGKHPNLHVLVESQVLRVLFEGTTAVGIEYQPNPDFQEPMPLTLTRVRTIKARRMVILSCGALATPRSHSDKSGPEGPAGDVLAAWPER